MTKRTLIIGIVSVLFVVILIFAIFFSYTYWVKGTPAYSFQQMQSAFKNHDTSAFNKYFDANSVFNNYWPRLKIQFSEAINQDQSTTDFSKQLAIATFNNSATTTEQGVENNIYEEVLGKPRSNSNEIRSSALDSIFTSKLVFTVKNNGVATADFTHENYAYKNPQNYPVYKLKIIMQQQGDRTWKVTDIQGFEDIMGSTISDVTRQTDAYTIGDLVSKYIKDSSTPILDSNNWRTVLTDYANRKGQNINLPEDPLISYSDANKYVFATANADSLKKYTYLVRVKMSTLDNDIFKSSAYNDLNYVDFISKISGGNNMILGVDCSRPAFCYLGWGLDSSWQKILDTSTSTSTH